MANIEQNERTAFVNDEEVYKKPTQAVPAPQTNIGVDTEESMLLNIVAAGLNGTLDLSEIDSFTHISSTRDQLYTLLDTMSEDPIVSAVLETYAEDSTEYNDAGQTVWATSDDENVLKYVEYLLNTMNVEKNIYKWAHSLCKYGDIYVRLFRESETKDLIFDPQEEAESFDESGKPLKEDINIKAYKKSDRYTHYVEMIPNPAEMYELTRFGKTSGYIRAKINSATINRNKVLEQSIYRYNFVKRDVDVYSATEFVHASLEDNSTRTPDEVNIFLTEKDFEANANGTSYGVKRGQSLLYSVFKIWRELMLLENSVMLNRLTKSSIVRLINVEVGDMPKERIGPHLQHIKQMIEQKAAINTNQSMSEYTNPGPVENNVYIPTHNGIGAITTQQVGGDVDVKSLADLDYFKNKFYGALRVPKQYFGDTDDAAGFNGGSSLTIISSRYAKMIKRIQSALKNMITDAVNLMLLDKGLDNYVNKFEIHMLPPTTQEAVDRRDNLANKVGITRDIMDLTQDIDDPIAKLKILKSLLSETINDVEVLSIIQEEIEKLESGEVPVSTTSKDDNEDLDFSTPISTDLETDFSNSVDTGTGEEISTEENSDETILPNPDQLGKDFTDSSEF